MNQRFRPLLALLIAVIIFTATGRRAHAAVIIDQPANSSLFGRVAQEFPNDPDFNAYEFDDIVTSIAYSLGILTVYGDEQGDSTQNTSVRAEIWSDLPPAGSVVLSQTGSQVGNNLVFDFGGATLPAGTYFLTAFVVRELTGGGQWFWNLNEPVTGLESHFFNPGGGFGFGTTVIPGSTGPFSADGPVNQAFTLEGAAAAAVPEPASLLLVGLGVFGSRFVRRRVRTS
jgi:hypothetical protein